MPQTFPTSDLADGSAVSLTGIDPDETRIDSFSDVRRALREKELAAPGALRLLIAELDRLSKELATARWFQERYFENKEALARIEERQKKSTITEILGTTCLTVGSVGLGAAKTYIELTVYGWIIFGLAAVFVLAGIAARLQR